MAQNELFARRDQHPDAGGLLRHSPYRRGVRMILQNVERFDCQVREWTLEMVAQGPQKIFLHTLTHHHASNKFDMVSQRNKTVQEVLNDLKKYAARMIHLPDIYTFRKWFVSALCDSLHNEVLKKRL